MRAEFREAGIPAEILDGLDKAGFVIVPKEPFASMIEYAYEAALAENAEGVWRDMIRSWESGQNGVASTMETLKEAIARSRASNIPDTDS